jgi:hypothetical protein
MSKLAKSMIIAIFIMAVSISAVSIAKANWPCPCASVRCENNVLKGDFCLPPSQNGYYFWYRPDNIHDWDYVLLVEEQDHPCDDLCSHYTVAMPWVDCDHYQWFLTEGNPGDIIEFEYPCIL